MPVVVVGAETPLGRVLVARLKAEGAEVRAVVEKPVADLGVPTSRTDWTDLERLGAVIDGAHTVVHLAARKHLGDVLAAAEDSGLARLVVPVRPGDSLGLMVPDGVEVVGVPDRRGRWRTSEAAIEAMAEAVVAADRRR